MDTNSTPLQTPVEPKKEDATKIVRQSVYLLLYVLVGALLVTIAIGLTNLYQKQKEEGAAKANKQIVADVFEMRRLANEYYKENKTYQNWDGNIQLQSDVAGYGSQLVITRPDYQSYFIYAKYVDSQNFFCVDSTGFVGDISQINQASRSCQK